MQTDKNQLIQKKKNAGGRKGKKKWATTLDATSLESQITKINDKSRKKEQEKKVEAIGFEIDAVPEQDKKKAPLNKDRFKKKNFEKVMSKKELKKIEKRATKIDSIIKQSDEANNNLYESDSQEEQVDEKNVWENDVEAVNKKLRTNKQNISVKRVIIPHEGLSYNPSAKAYDSLVKQVVEHEMKKDHIKTVNAKQSKKFEREIEISKNKNLKRRKTKNDKEKLEQEIADAKKREKQLNHQFLNIKNIKKEIQQTENEILERQKEREENEFQEKINQENLGIVNKSKKISNLNYQMKHDIVAEEDIPDNLRQINQTGNLVREQFDSTFRRGMLEVRKVHQKNNRKNKVPTRKAYGRGRNMTEEDDWMNENAVVKNAQSLQITN